MASDSPSSKIPFGYTFQESSDYPEERVPTPPAGPGLLDPFESEDFGQFLHGVGSRSQHPQGNIAHGLLSQLSPLPADGSAHSGNASEERKSVAELCNPSPKSSLHAASSSSDDTARQRPDVIRFKAKLTARKGKRAARAVSGRDLSSSHQSQLTGSKAKKTTRKNAKTIEEIESDRVKHNIKETNRRSEQADARDKLFGLVPGMGEADLLKDGQVIFFVQWLRQVLYDNERMEQHLVELTDSSYRPRA
ncbi:MAG: hypothetical protein Q9174_000155 [Haloplaca sp. 1 TL-2023]